MNHLIIGGTKGIGKGLVSYLNKEKANCVVYTGRSITLGLGRRCPGIDLEKKTTIKQFVKNFKKFNFSPHIICFNAGINIREDFERMTFESYNKIMNVNLRGHVFLTQEFIKNGIIKENQKLIYIGSVAGEYHGPKTVHYMLSKAGIISFTKFLAQKYAHRNILVNCICPGIIATNQTKSEFDSGAANDIINRTLVKRPGLIDDVISAYQFISDTKQQYLTGQSIRISGGAVL